MSGIGTGSGGTGGTGGTGGAGFTLGGSRHHAKHQTSGGGSTNIGGFATGGSGGSGGDGGQALGGALFVAGGSLTVEQDTVAANSVAGGKGGSGGPGGKGGSYGQGNGPAGPAGQAGDGSAGALYIDGGTVSLYNSTVALNTQSGGGSVGGALQVGGSVKAVSTLFAGNGAVDYSGTLTATDSLIQAAPSTDTISGSGNQINVNPLLATAGLANNGGPTQTIALQAGSPAIGKGTNPESLTTDQRGYGPRTGPGGTDIGAVQHDAAAVTTAATFLEKDATTQGSWIGTYGAQGYDIVCGPSSLPANDTVTPSGQSTYTWTTTSTDPRALQVPGSSNRVAAVWYSATSFTVDVNLADGQTHDLELYFDDWDNKGRSEQVQISNAATGTVLDTETISSFTNGVYLDWKVSGNLVITITRQAGANAVLNGLFLDPTSSPTPTATASFLEKDTTTQGSWIGTYGAQGYDIVSGPSSLPANDTVTPSGQSTYTWTTTSTDPRALQVPGSSNRVAAVWYSATSFTVDVNLGRRPDARPGAVLRRLGQQGPQRAGADQRRRHGDGAGHRDDLVVHQRRVPGLEGLGQPGDHDHPAGRGQCRPQRLVPRPDVIAARPPRPRASSRRTRRRRGAGSAPTARRATTSSAARPASRPTTRSRPAASRPIPGRRPPPTPAPCRSPARRTASPPSGTPPPASPSTSTSADGQTHDLELYFDDWDNKGRSEQVQISDAGTGNGAGHRDDLVVHQWRVPGLEGLGQPGDHDHPGGRGQCRAQRPVPGRRDR